MNAHWGFPRAIFEDLNANAVQMAPNKSTTPNRIRGGLAWPNGTKMAKKTMSVGRTWTVHRKKAAIS